ncbi:MAG: Arm DNA-binding domain-containing protein [Pseudomonadota bacterium]
MTAKGKHRTNVLTTQAIKRLAGPKRYPDGGRLYLQVDQTGTKRWLMRITIGGKRRDLGLGGWPTVALANARKKAAKIRLDLIEGIDPIQNRRKA